MDDVGFILATYIATFVGAAGLAAYYVRRARHLADQLPPSERPWT